MVKRLKSIAHNLAYSYLRSIRRKRDARVGMFLCASVAIIMTIYLVENYFKDGIKPDPGVLIFNGLFYIGWLIDYFIQKSDSGRVLIKPQNLKYVIIGIPLAFLVIVFLFQTYLEVYIPEENETVNKYYTVIERGLGSIKNLPGAERQAATSTDSMKRSNVVLIGADFNSDASYEEIKNYYMAELKNEGWEFVSEESVKEWGKDYGLKALDFKKDGMELELFYIPPDHYEEYGCNYSISIDLEF